MWKRVIFDFVRQEFSGPSGIWCLIVYCLFTGPLLLLGGGIVVLKLIDSHHVVAVVLGKDPLFTFLLVLPMIAWIGIIAIRFIAYLRSDRSIEPK
ncbi:MAG: hypothetical protein JWP89_3454 [Schlesneria sp.]|nr:hypothetical protein [Schlesneria sp.]